MGCLRNWKKTKKFFRTNPYGQNRRCGATIPFITLISIFLIDFPYSAFLYSKLSHKALYSERH